MARRPSGGRGAGVGVSEGEGLVYMVYIGADRRIPMQGCMAYALRGRRGDPSLRRRRQGGAFGQSFGVDRSGQESEPKVGLVGRYNSIAVMVAMIDPSHSQGSPRSGR